MPNFVCLRQCVQDEKQVSQTFTDKPHTLGKSSKQSHSVVTLLSKGSAVAQW